ncbi:macrophage colony-stimulating factor 1 receptor 2-like [Solea senegalensis]|uniref:Macrophage colony-stimulating factor 1 receptor 2-like n=1 Tax=Solea senegalensis TaxID=28829 RepID=A0AAV6SEC7_SOLSE|nr:macrophage colony-stimulating factor 1 receptor 2-like [Solea senegalensis]KAG7515729.1 macrophage colony-stimulating factor 1 receptor 2-like [Solea senegalensis]
MTRGLFVSDLFHPPMIHLNNVFLLNQSEAVVTAGSAIILRCCGDSAVRWSSTAFRLQYHDNLPDLLEVTRSVPRHTGTYRCGYSAHNLRHLNTWIHLYVKDPVHTTRVFETPRGVPPVKEGQDFLFKCQLTDPSVTNLTFQSDSRGRSLPQGMNVTFDRRSGVLIRDVQRTFNGRYVCSGLKDGRPVQSAPVDLLVVPMTAYGVKRVCIYSAHHPLLDASSLTVFTVAILRGHMVTAAPGRDNGRGHVVVV